jgi:hypothetical protein
MKMEQTGCSETSAYKIQTPEIRPMEMEQTGCSETSAYKIQTPGNYPEEKKKNTTFREVVCKVIRFRINFPIFAKRI